MSLQETPSIIPKNWIYSEKTISTISIHNGKWNYTQTHFIISKKFGFTLKVSLKETFHNFHPQWKISNFEETHLSQFSKNEIILRVFHEATPSIILKKLGLY